MPLIAAPTSLDSSTAMPASLVAQATELSVPVFVGPLIAAVLFAIGAAALKSSAKYRLGVWRTTFLCNVYIAVVYLPGLAFGTDSVPWHLCWQPPLVGLLYLTGQTSTVLALTRGDVSVAGPVLAMKILIVAVLTTIVLQQPIGASVWWAALLATFGVALLNLGGRPEDRRRALFTAALAILAASSFASFDILLQRFAPAWGSFRFFSVMLISSAMMSLAFIPGFQGRWRDIPKAAWPSVALGVGFLGTQSLVFGSTIALFGHATECNVVYASRGLFSVLMVLALRQRLNNDEAKLPKLVMRARLFGASLMTFAIFLLLL